MPEGPIVDNLRALPTPTAMWSRLLFAVVSCLVGGAILAAVCTRSLMDSPSFLDVAWVTVAALFVSIALAALTLIRLIRRTSIVYRMAFRRGEGDVPPSESAVRDVFAAPVVVATSCLAGHTLVALVVGVGLLPDSFSLGDSAVSTALVLAGAGLLTATPMMWWIRHLLSDWLRPYSADDLDIALPDSTQKRLGVEVGVAVAGATLLGQGALTSLVTVESQGVPTVWLLALGLAVAVIVTLVVGVLAARGADNYRQDVLRLSEAIDSYGQRLAATHANAERITPSVLGSEPARRLVAELGTLAARFSETAKAEDLARQSVEELQRQKMLFMASMSHDLRSPLNSILGFSDLLTAGIDGSLNDAQKDSVHTIRRSGDELLRLLNDVLDSARFEAGRLPLRKEWTPSVEILTEAVRHGRELVADTELQIEPELQPGLPPVYVDRERIVQAVVGLFGHAARAMDRGTIRVLANVADGPDGPASQVRVAVVDSSAGIRAADRQRIFQAFREVAEPSGRRIGGLGLGLSLARALVLAHGGEVKCESQENRGTTFTVELPISGPEPERAGTERSRRRGRSGRRG